MLILDKILNNENNADIIDTMIYDDDNYEPIQAYKM